MRKRNYDDNLLGRRFGSLTVVSKFSCKDKAGYVKWNCVCDCGSSTVSVSYNLIRGRATCCGHNHKDVLGKTFGDLTVIKRLENSNDNNARRWFCVCSCGREKIVKTHYLTSGKIRNCGCKRVKYTDRSIPVINRLLYNYKRNAKIKKRKFSLSRGQFITITSSKCHYCGSFPANIASDNLKGNKSSYTYNGIDRKNSSEGYTVSNSLPCCKKCNFTKGDKSYDEFLSWKKRITNNLEKIKEFYFCNQKGSIK